MNMKAVSLLSGGLDSLIDTKIIVEQGIHVEALHFTSPFCTCGSACTSGSTKPSHVLQAMGIPYAMARGVVRFSLSAYNTAEEIDHAVEHLTDIVQGLRRNSPNWKARSVCAHT